MIYFYGKSTANTFRFFDYLDVPIAFIEPSTGELRESPLYPLFWASIGGIIIIIVYSSYKAKKEKSKS